MSNQLSIIKEFITKPPALFPWVGLFHILWFFIAIWNCHTEPFPSISWIQSLWMLGYMIFWVFSCGLYRWAAIGYIAVTTLNLALRLIITSHNDRLIYADALFPIDILFTFFILFFFKRFE